MRLALMSDLHANLHALQACLAHAREQQVTQYAFLGDLVGYGADPGAVVDLVMGLAEEGALVLKGNHDEMAARPPEGQQTLGETTARWTHAQLDAGQRAYLDSHAHDPAASTAPCWCTPPVDEPELWRYVYDAAAAGQSLDAASAQEQVRYVFGGHVHRQSLYYRAADGQLVPFVITDCP